MTISFMGIASGFDTSRIISELMHLERAPIRRKEALIGRSDALRGHWRQLNISMQKLRRSFSPLLSSATFSSMTALSSNPAALGASVSGSPAAGSHEIEVLQTAARHAAAMAAPAEPVGNPAEALGLFGSFYLNRGRPAAGLAELRLSLDPGGGNRLRGTLSAGYHAVADGSGETVYPLNVESLAFKLPEGQQGSEIKVYLEAFSGEDGAELVDALRAYHTGKGWSLPDEVYLGASPVMIIKQDGLGGWRAYAHDGETPFAFLGDHPLGSFRFRGEILDNGGARLAEHRFSFKITDRTETSGKITVTPDDSLESIAGKINALTGETGVSASVLKRAAGDYRLLLMSGSEGLDGAIQAWHYAPLDSAGEAVYGTENVLLRLRLINDCNGVTAVYANEVQQARDARLKVNGFEVERGSNRINDLISGLRLELQGKGSSMVEVAADTERAILAVSEFVVAYNELNTEIRSLLAHEGGPLSGDITLMAIERNLRQQLHSMVSGLPGQEAMPFRSLAELGISSIDKSGTLYLEEGKLRAALQQNAAAVSSIFSRTAPAGDSSEGIVRRLERYSASLVNFGGIIPRREGFYHQRMAEYQKRIERLEQRLALRERVLVQRFAFLEQYITGMQAQSGFINNFFEQMAGQPEE